MSIYCKQIYRALSVHSKLSKSLPQILHAKKIPRKVIVGLGNFGSTYESTRHNIGRTAVQYFLQNYVNPLLSENKQFVLQKQIKGQIADFKIAFGNSSRGTAIIHDDLVDRYSVRSKRRTELDGVPYTDIQVFLLLPETFMNRSGTCVRAFMEMYSWKKKKNPDALNACDDMLLIADDVSLPFGTIRFQSRGSAGGQNGVKDILKCTQSDRIPRLKVGVGRQEWFMNGNTGAPSGYPMDKYVLSRFSAAEQDQVPFLLKYIEEALRVYLHRGLVKGSATVNGINLESYLAKLTKYASKSSKPSNI